MLPSMPILFTRESQDAFGNKIEPSTSFCPQNFTPKTSINPKPPPSKKTEVVSTLTQQKETKNKPNCKDNEESKQESINNGSALEAALVKSYYTKIQSRFGSNQNVHTNKFVQFQNILKTFDPSKENPVDLYKKIEELFGIDHKDIVEEFLLFLKPGQAAKIGRFMDYFMLVQLTHFIEMLKNTFTRKPIVLRKILRALTTGLNRGNTNDIKSRVLPHLRANPKLKQLFMSLFPDERPPESAYEIGADNLHEDFLTNDKGFDIWEFEEENDNKKKLDSKESLDTMYLHGRVFLQHRRLLRSATVTYPYSKEPYRVHMRRLAPAHCHLSSPEPNDEITSSPKRNKSNKIPNKKTKKSKSPTKNVKDVNDNTKHKDICPVVNSPKIKKPQNITKNRGLKDKKESEKPDNKSDVVVLKREKKEKNDSKSPMDQKKDESPKAKQAKIEVVTTMETKTVEVKNSNWTRDEDKTMLEVIKGDSVSDKVFIRIQELLPHRTVSDIKERFFHVMNLLQQMAVSEVT